MRIGGKISIVAHAMTHVRNADIFAIKFLEARRVPATVAWHRLPKIAALKEFEAWARDIYRLHRVDEPKKLWSIRAKVLTHLAYKCKHAWADHYMINHLGIRRDFRKISSIRGIHHRNRDKSCNFTAMFCRRLAKEITMVVAKSKIRINHRDFLTEICNPFSDSRDL